MFSEMFIALVITVAYFKCFSAGRGRQILVFLIIMLVNLWKEAWHAPVQSSFQDMLSQKVKTLYVCSSGTTHMCGVGEVGGGLGVNTKMKALSEGCTVYVWGQE